MIEGGARRAPDRGAQNSSVIAALYERPIPGTVTPHGMVAVDIDAP